MTIEQEDMFPELLPREEGNDPQLERQKAERQKGLAELEKLEEEMDRCPQCETGYCGKHTDTHRIMVLRRNQN